MRFTDQTGHTFTLDARPRRIVSLVPSITELLADLGLENEVVGITRFCVHPGSWFESKTRIGGTKDPKIDGIKALHADLIIANKEENTAEDVLTLRESCPVWVSDVSSLESAIDMILQLGELTGTSEKAASIANQTRQGFNALSQFIEDRNYNRKNALYFIWKDPWMVAGTDTFIADMIRRCGWTNAEPRTRYPVWDFKNNDTSPIELVLLSSEPYPFRERHLNELQSFFPHSKILLVDGEFFSWYGSRMRMAPAFFQELLSST